MARDESLLSGVSEGESPPTLRLYQWECPTISLGYFQRFADYLALAKPAGELPVVRRLTGGGAILHDLELTYSLAIPNEHELLSSGANRLYELAHDAIIACLNQMNIESNRCGTTDDSTPTRGPFFCFERRHCYDVVTGLQKIAGSAQRRTRQAMLQHGSIVFGNRFDQHKVAEVDRPFLETIEQISREFPSQLANVTGETLEIGNWLEAELDAAAQLISKYAGDEWTKRT